MAETRNVRFVAGKVGTIQTAVVGKEGNEKPVVIVGVDTPEGSFDVQLYLSPGAMPYTKEKLVALGLPDGKGPAWLEENPEALRGNAATVKVYEECYNDKWTTKTDISTYQRKVKKMTPEKLAAFDGLFLNTAVRPPAEPGPPPPEEKGVDDSDIPF